jgi:ribonuclease inhibitor
MKMCILDGKQLYSRKELHAAIAEALNLPEWYGANLDALYDCLTDLQEETQLQICHETELREHLGDYVQKLLKVLQAASEENPVFTWTAS